MYPRLRWIANPQERLAELRFLLRLTDALRNGNRGRAKQEQQTSDRQNSGLSEPNSE